MEKKLKKYKLVKLIVAFAATDKEMEVRTLNAFSEGAQLKPWQQRISGTYLAGPLWVIKQAQWISVEQGHCTLAVVKRYWSVPRML